MLRGAAQAPVQPAAAGKLATKALRMAAPQQ